MISEGSKPQFEEWILTPEGIQWKKDVLFGFKSADMKYSGTKSGKVSSKTYGNSWIQNIPKSAPSMEKEMAVIIEIEGLKLEDLMNKLDCEQEQISLAMNAGVKATYQSDGILVQDASGLIQHLATIKLGVLQSILENKLPGGATKNIARTLLTKAVKKVLAQLPQPAFSDGPPVFGEAVELPPSPSLNDIFTVGKAFPIKQPETVLTVSGQDSFDIDSLSTHPAISTPKKKAGNLPAQAKIPLINATTLYQPVNGSSEESVYFAIALHPDIKVAVRIKDNDEATSISIRAEGKPQYHTRMLAAGLSSSNSHYSIHLTTPDKTLARKTVGAVLYGMQCQFDSVTTDLDPIWGQGV